MDRGEAFTVYIGAELKGLIASRGWSAAAVARATGHSASALNRWLNGKQALPLPVLLEASDVLGIDPREVVARAYSRLGHPATPTVSSASPRARAVAPSLPSAYGSNAVGDDSVPYAAHTVEMSASAEAEMMEEMP